MKVQEERSNKTDAQIVNFAVGLCYTIECSVIGVAYLAEFAKGSRTLPYVLLIFFLALLPAIAGWCFYRKDPETPMIRWTVGAGFAVLYTVVLFTTSNPLVFIYIVPILIAIGLFKDQKYTFALGIIVILENIIQVASIAMRQGIAKEDTALYEIQILVMIIIVAFSIYTSWISQSIDQRQLASIGSQKERSDQLLEKVLSTSSQMVDRINTISESVNLLGGSVGGTLNAMEELSEGTRDTADAIQKQMAQTEAIQSKVEQVQQVSDRIAGNMGEAKKALKEGDGRMRNLVSQMEQAEKRNSQIDQELSTLQKEMEQMDSIIEIINNITSQTSLLSLNASIEAARAGEAGKGFAVVASEISQLASQTQNATVNIEHLVEEVSGEIKKVSDILHEMVVQIQEQSRIIQGTADSFIRVEENAENIDAESSVLVEIVDDLKNSNMVITESIQTISAISEEVVAHTNSTSENCNENEQTVRQVMLQSEELRELAQKLQI